jgi:hypothetical protein
VPRVTHSRLAQSAALALALLAGACQRSRTPAPFDVGFRGPGRLVALFENADPDVPRTLVLFDREGARALPIEKPRGARWISAHTLLVSQEVPSSEPYGLPNTQFVRLDVESGKTEPFATPARWFDAEPDPSGERLAAGVEVDDQGESELVLLALGSRGEKPLADVTRPLDRPRWSPDGRSLVVLQTLGDAEDEEDETGVSFGGQSVAFPRLFRVPAELSGKLELLRDGDPGGPLAPGGSLPLWWGARGVYARQRRGLVLCDPAGSGCGLVFAPGEKKRVVEGRPAGPNRALLLVRDFANGSEVELPQELYQVALDSGAGKVIYKAPDDVYLSDIDWVDAS